jgi:hypothetical protein
MKGVAMKSAWLILAGVLIGISLAMLAVPMSAEAG